MDKHNQRNLAMGGVLMVSLTLAGTEEYLRGQTERELEDLKDKYNIAIMAVHDCRAAKTPNEEAVKKSDREIPLFGASARENIVERDVLKVFEQKIARGTHLVKFKLPDDICPPCKIMKPVFQKTANQHPEIQVMEVYGSTDEYSGSGPINTYSIIQKYSIKGYPTIIVFKDGREIGRIVGADNAEMLENRVKAIIRK